MGGDGSVPVFASRVDPVGERAREPEFLDCGTWEDDAWSVTAGSRICFYLPLSLKNDFADFCRRRGMSMTDVLSRLVRQVMRTASSGAAPGNQESPGRAGEKEHTKLGG